jgi:hypothetical protein
MFFRPRAFSVTPRQITGKVGDAAKLQLRNGTAQFVHSDPTVATVDSGGQVRLVGGGEAAVYVVHATGTITVPVTVAGPPAIELSGTGQTYSLEQRVADLEAWQRRHEGAMHGS